MTVKTITYKLLSRIKYTFASILASITYRSDNFLAHYHGPDVQYAVDDYFNWLKWQYKADKKIDPWDAREKLAEFLNERGVSWD